MKTCCLISCVFLCLLRTHGAETPQARLDEKQRAFFKDYCVGCHNEKKQKGKLRLDDISFAIETVAQADCWQKILNQLNSGDMPPEDAKQAERNRKTEFLDSLSRTLVTARKITGDQGGRIAMRRLNQREYKNTMRELLGVEIDARDLPEDGGTGAFDTVGASLFMSSDQIEQYLALGRRALDEHFAQSKASKTFKAREEAEVFGNKRMNGLLKHTAEMHEKYVRWTAAVDEAAKRPENVKIAGQLRKKVERPIPSSGVPYATPMLFYHDWEQIQGAPSPVKFGFMDAQKAFFEALQYKNNFSYYTDYQLLPGRDTGAWLLFYMAYRETYVIADPKWPSGRYTLRMRVAANEAAPMNRCFVEIGQRGEDPVSDFTVLSAHQVTGTLAQPQLIELSVNVSADGKREFALREKRPNSRTAEIRSYHDEFEKTGHGPMPAIWVDWFEIEGPVHSPSNASQTLVTPAEDVASARTVIERFAHRAFRGTPPEPEYLDRLMALFATRRKLGDSFEEALKEPLSVVLASPGFLYLSEPSAEKGHRRLNSFELASRLSYFLWSGPPDDELLALARNNSLQQPLMLAAQVRRLLADEKSEQFVSGFTHQWLGLDRLDFFQFDFKLHRGFDDSTKMAAREEVYQTVACLLRENLSLRDLLKSDFVVINGLLASYYGMDGVSGDAFRKVSLPASSPRGGLLGMAAILAMGGNGQFTSPVERGAWVLRKLLHDPPPPAPPNVPQLARLEGRLFNVRERMQAHQEEPQCANCHRKIDPIGFGLENFDAAGLWRTEDTYERKGGASKTWPVDPAAAFYKGPAFKDYFELRNIIASKPDVFARSFTEALIEYALGRSFGFHDEDLAAGIIKQAGEKNYSITGFIQALIASEAFHTK
jgi:uncharacterized protein DUF1592/uncharacterized protein DUF1588/uncharacterized protein DUF1587/uncharacterized protein DUF1595/uncharacterized protein DUF1585/cytochrome c